MSHEILGDCLMYKDNLQILLQDFRNPVAHKLNFVLSIYARQ